MYAYILLVNKELYVCIYHAHTSWVTFLLLYQHSIYHSMSHTTVPSHHCMM